MEAASVDVWLFFIDQNIRRYCTTAIGGTAISVLGILRTCSVH